MWGGASETLGKHKYCRCVFTMYGKKGIFLLFVKHVQSGPYQWSWANRLKNTCCVAIKLYGTWTSKPVPSSHRIASCGCYARISIWPFYVNLMRKSSCIYARDRVHLPNILIGEEGIKYLLGGLRIRRKGREGVDSVLCCRENLWWKSGQKGGGDWLSVRVSLSASRCHHLKAFGSSESVGRVDLKCPLAQTRTRIHIGAYKLFIYY